MVFYVTDVYACVISFNLWNIWNFDVYCILFGWGELETQFFFQYIIVLDFDRIMFNWRENIRNEIFSIYFYGLSFREREILNMLCLIVEKIWRTIVFFNLWIILDRFVLGLDRGKCLKLGKFFFLNLWIVLNDYMSCLTMRKYWEWKKKLISIYGCFWMVVSCLLMEKMLGWIKEYLSNCILVVLFGWMIFFLLLH